MAKITEPSTLISRYSGIPKTAIIGKSVGGVQTFRRHTKSAFRSEAIKNRVINSEDDIRDAFLSLPVEVRASYEADAIQFSIPVFQLFRKSDLSSRFNVGYGRSKYGIGRYGG